MTKLCAQDVLYYCDSDEKMFFEALRVNLAVIDFYGVGSNLIIEYEDSKATYDTFMSIYSLFKRYGIDTQQLANIDTSHDQELIRTLRDKQMIWYEDIFGQSPQ